MKNTYAAFAFTGCMLMGLSVSAQSSKRALSNQAPGQTQLSSVFQTSLKTSGHHANGLKPGVVAGHVDDAARGGGAPANDECTGAISLTVGATCTPVSGSNVGATESQPASAECGQWTSPAANDVWYSFTATSDFTNVDLRGISDYDAIVEVFSGACGSLTHMACSDNNFPQDPFAADSTESLTVATTIGDLYYVRAYYYNVPVPASLDFTICAYQGEAPPPAPANDACSGAVNEDLAVGSTLTFSGDNTGATEDGGTGFVIVWHAFTTTECANVTINYCVPGSEFTNHLVNLAVQCPDFVTGVLTGVNDSCSVTFLSLPAGMYYVPVMVDPTSTPIGPYTIEVSATSCAPAPSNDVCGSTPVDLAADNSINFSGTTVGATNTGDFVAGSGLEGQAATVWHEFTTTECVNLAISYCGTTPKFTGVWIFLSPSCPAGDDYILATSYDTLACADGNETLLYDALPPGTYHLPVMFDAAEANGPYTIEVSATGCGSGVQELNSANVSVYPNPSNGDITIGGADLSGDVNFELTDMTGRVVYQEQKSMNAGQPVTLALNGKLALGTYSLRMTTANGISSRAVMIK